MLKPEMLDKEIKTKDLTGIYLLFGEETYLLENSLKKMRKSFGTLVKGINYILLDADSVESIISDIETPAFGYEKKLIIARDTGLFKPNNKKQSEGVKKIKDKLNDYIKENIDIINQSTLIIFVEQEVGKNNKLYTTIDKLGYVCKFEAQTVAQLKKRLGAICNAYGVKIDNPTLQYFIECCGTNMQDLINEIRKLIEYAGKRRYDKKRRY